MSKFKKYGAWVLGLLSVAAFAQPSCASLVTISGAGNLDSASGVFHPGDAFSFTATYDDAAAPSFVSAGVSYFPGVSAFYFTVDGMQFHPLVTYSTTFDGATLGFGTPGDYAPMASGSIGVNRPAQSPSMLPTSSQIAGKSGRFNFSIPALQPGSGAGTFLTPAVVAIPEPALDDLFAIGLFVLLALSQLKNERWAVQKRCFATA